MINVLDWKHKWNRAYGNTLLISESESISYDSMCSRDLKVPKNYSEYRERYTKLFNRKLPG